MEQTLEKLFESPIKIRLIRLFVRNQDRSFTLKDVLKLCQTNMAGTQKELSKLIKIGLIKRKTAVFREEVKGGKKAKKRGKAVFRTHKETVYSPNTGFPLLNDLRDLMGNVAVASRKKILNDARKLGKVKMLVLGGVFMRNEGARTDLLIVGEKIRKARLESFLGQLESELGKPIQYALMDTAEYKYRQHMYDRFLREILESPHEKLIDTIRA